MPSRRSKFAGGDQAYVRDVQYSGSDRLLTRARLHARYSTAEVPWFDWIGPKFALQPGSRVLEVGCGAGWLWERSTMHVPEGVRLTLTDLSPGMVAEAVSRVVAERFAAVSGEVADAQTLPFEDGSFDRVVANHMLYHLPDPRHGVAELVRVVDPDGRVVVATNGRRHLRELWTIRSAVFELDEPVDQTVDVFGVESGFPILRDYFEEVAWAAYRDELRCTSPDDVIAYICSTPPAEDGTDEQRTAVAAEVHAAFDAAGGVMTITKDTGCFVCTRPLVNDSPRVLPGISC